MSKISSDTAELIGYWQQEQELHDPKYHSDIYFRKPKDRMNHYAHHFAKYVGRLARSSKMPLASDVARKTITDTALIAFSASNALRLNLQALTIGKTIPVLQQSDVLHTLADPMGRIADFMDKQDHLEENAPQLSEAILEIMFWVMAAARVYDMDLALYIRERRNEIRISRNPVVGLRAIA